MAWSLHQACPIPVASSVAGTTGLTLAFGGSVANGSVIIAASLWNTGTATTPTFSDSLGNVTGWQTAASGAAATANLNVAIGWAIAGGAVACTPKVVWADGVTRTCELFIGDFTSPGGTVTQDGSGTFQNQVANTSSIVLPAGGGSQSDDLVICMIGCGQTFSSWTVATPQWQDMATSATLGDRAGYLLDVAGNSTPNATQSPAGAYGCVVAAFQASGGGAATQNVLPDADITTTGWTPSSGTTLYGVLADGSDATYDSATLA